MSIVPNKFTFGRNETFSLRYSWIPKGIGACLKNHKVFSEDSAPLELGVGKNMVKSIKYWLEAYQVIKEDGTLTVFGEQVFHPETGFDPFLEDEATLWLLHWKLCSNPEKATMYYWFFNDFRKKSFTKNEVLSQLKDWLSGSRKVSEKTLDRDTALLLRSYSAEENEKSFEESLDHPFGALALITKAQELLYKSENKLREIDPLILGYALMDFIEDSAKQKDLIEVKKESIKSIPIQDLMNSNDNPSLTGIFRLNENNFVSLIEELVNLYQSGFELRETAGMKQLFLLDSSPTSEDLLEDYYSKLL